MNELKKIVIFCLAFLLSSDIWYATDMAKELYIITDIMEEHAYTIDHWRIVFKEKLSSQQLNHIQDKLPQQTLTQDENHQRILLTSTQQDEFFTTTYHLLIPKNRQISPELIVVLEDDQWTNEHQASLHEKINVVTSTYFTELANSYTCVSAINNDIINHVNFLLNLKKTLDLTITEKQIDKTQSTNKQIIYGFTPRWDNEIHVFDRRLNIQIVSWIEEANKIIVGTPILISEY